MSNEIPAPRVAIACGGTGGHFFPGVAVAEELRERGCEPTLLISRKAVDQQAAAAAGDWRTVVLPGVGLTRGGWLGFGRAFAQSYRASRELFQREKPEAVLAMGGFTAAAPLLAGRALGVPTYLHESNAIPGRANRWLARTVSRAFVGFPQAATRLHAKKIQLTGTPVRPQFQPLDAAICRAALGLDPQRPVLAVIGGSQGAGGLNRAVMDALPLLAKRMPELQLLHLTGPDDAEKVRDACAASGMTAVVYSFRAEMHLVLGAATAAISRAGASSIAELAAMRVPAILVPYPAAADDHQYFNALALVETGAARVLRQDAARRETVVAQVAELIGDAAKREKMRAGLAAWHSPRAASEIAESIMQMIIARRAEAGAAAGSESNIQFHNSAPR